MVEITTGTATGTAAGVPFVARPPSGEARPDAPVVVAWHLLDPPRTERAFAAALPLDGLDAWRFYLGLPLSGSRLPDGGIEEVMRLGYEDAVRNLHGAIGDQAVAELPPALAALRERFGLGDAPLGLLGGSAGSTVAGRTAIETPAAAAVLVSPVADLRALVTALGRSYGFEYPWDAGSEVIADRMDLVARAGELGTTPVELVVGEDDDTDAVRAPAARLHEALSSSRLLTVPGMAHALAEEPGEDPAPQTAHAATVDAHAVAWFRQHLLP